MELSEAISSCTLFSKSDRKSFWNDIIDQSDSDSEECYVSCIVRKRRIQLTPEEIVRQLYARFLINYGIPRSCIQFEKRVQIGSSPCRVDIAIFDENSDFKIPDIIVEVKKPGLEQDSQIAQLKGYCVVMGVQYGIYINGQTIRYFQCESANEFYELDVPPLFLPGIVNGKPTKTVSWFKRRHARRLDAIADKKALQQKSRKPTTSVRKAQRQQTQTGVGLFTIINQLIFRICIPIVILLIMGNIGVWRANIGDKSGSTLCGLTCQLFYGLMFVYYPWIIWLFIKNTFNASTTRQDRRRMATNLKLCLWSLIKTGLIVTAIGSCWYFSGK